MSLGTELESQSFVLLRLGERRFALHAADVGEMVTPGRIHRFPHQTPGVDGVLLRRGRVIPVCEIAQKLTGTRLSARRFYLIAARRYGSAKEWVALAVSAECELIASEMAPQSGGDHPPHVAGWLSHEGEMIEVLDLNQLTPGPADDGEAQPLQTPGETRP
jgi:chemotaxis signal transduction protein